MRALRASRVIVDAEALRLRLQARRLAGRVVLAAVALVFLLCTLVFAHLAAWFWLRMDRGLTRETTAAVVAVGDLVIAAALAAMAVRLGPGAAEAEARLLREQAWSALVVSVSWPALVLRVLRLLRRA